MSSFDPNTVTDIATEMDIPAKTSSSASSTVTGTASKTRSVTVTPTPTEVYNNDDSGEYIPPPTPDESYYETEGADGSSTGFINVSVGAQVGIIVAIVLVGLGIMGGCIWFWTKKQKEWKAALERRRTLRASRIAAAKAAGTGTKKPSSKKAEEKKGGEKKGTELTKMKKGNKNGSSSTVVSTEVTAVDVERSQFDVMTPTESESPSWWKKVLPKKK